MEEYLYWYIRNLGILTNTYIKSFATEQVASKVLFRLYFIEHIPLSQIKMFLTKEKSRIKQALKENGYNKNIISKIFKRITNNRS